MKTITGLFFTLSVFIISSCKKNDSPPPVNSATDCVLKTLQTDTTSERFYYDKNNQLSSIGITIGTVHDSAVYITDANGNIVKLYTIYEKKDTVLRDEYVLNSNNKIVKYYNYIAFPGPAFSAWMYEAWAYGANNRPSQIVTYYYSRTKPILSDSSLYTYDGIGNVITKTSFDANSKLVSTETYQYDAKKRANHFKGNLPDVMNDNVNNVTDDIVKDEKGGITTHVTTVFDYNNTGYPIKETQTDNKGVKTVYNYVYDCK